MSRIFLAAKNCLTAQASTNSSAIIIQNISLNRFHRAFHLFGDGTFGWTEVQAHTIIVELQLQIMFVSTPSSPGTHQPCWQVWAQLRQYDDLRGKYSWEVKEMVVVCCVPGFPARLTPFWIH